MEIVVLNRQRGQAVDSAVLAEFMRRLIEIERPQRGDTLALCLVSDRRMRELNRGFRGLDAPTDVLSFPGDSRPDPEGQVHLGDIAISAETASRQARAAGHSLERELSLLALHGYLHLLGFDHETDGGEMMRRQAALARRLRARAAQGRSA